MTGALATLVPLEQVPPAEIERLLDRAFGPDRRQRTAYRIRDGVDWVRPLGFALTDAGERLVGTVQVWPVALTEPAGRAHRLLMVGPVAILPEEQDRGHGRALLGALTQALDTPGPAGEAHPAQMLIGDPDYYGRFGFRGEHTGGWKVPGPCERHRLLARAVAGGALPREGMLGPWRG